MTDLERSIEFFKSLGYKEISHPNETRSWFPDIKEYFKDQEGEELQLYFGQGLYGYAGFGFLMRFDKDGKFLGHGSFE